MKEFNYLLFPILFLSIPLLSQTKRPSEKVLSYSERIKLERINDVYIPKNTEEALMELFRLSEEKGREKMKQTTEDIIASKLHFSLGRWILLNWGFEEGSRLSHYYKKQGVTFPDDMVDLLLRSFYRKINNLEVNEKELLSKYKKQRKLEMEEIKKKRKMEQKLNSTKQKHLE